jgi:hypothetical protein
LRGRIQPPPQFLLALQKAPQFPARSRASSGRERFDLFLHGGQFFLRTPASQNGETAFGFFPGGGRGGFEGNFEKQPAVAVF